MSPIVNHSFIGRFLFVLFVFIVVVDLPVALYFTHRKIEQQEQTVTKNITEVVYFFATTPQKKLIAGKQQQHLLDAISWPFLQVWMTAKPHYTNRMNSNRTVLTGHALIDKKSIGQQISTNLHVRILHGDLTAKFSYYVGQQHQWLNFSFNNRVISPLMVFFLLLQLALIFIGLSYLLIIQRLMRTWAPLHRLAKQLGIETANKCVPLLSWKAVKESIILIENISKRLNDLLNEKVSTIAALSHDIRTLLTRALLYVELMPSSSYQKKLEKQLLEIQYLLDETLSYAKQGYHAEPKNLLEMVSLIESTCLNFQAIGKAVNYQSDVNEFVMHGQRVSLQRAITNLIENAIKYGQIATVRIRKLNEKLIVTVDDHGNGLPDELLEKIFMPFYRYDTSRSRQTGGTGLGLTIAKAIIEYNLGNIYLTNLEQGGLRVQLSFVVNNVSISNNNG